MIAEAQDAKIAEETKEVDSAYQAGQAVQLDAEIQGYLAAARAPGAPTQTVVDNGRDAAVKLLQTGGSWLRSAAEDALSGSPEDVVSFVRSTMDVAVQQDNRASVGHIADTTANHGEKLAAVDALQESDLSVAQFLDDRWYMGKEDDDQIAVAQLMTTGGPGVRAAAQQALEGTPDDRALFLAKGQYTAAEDDARVAVTQAMSTGGPEVQAAAQAALNGPADGLATFLTEELYRAQERDADTARHVSTIDSMLAEIARTAAIARQNAQEAQAAAYRAAGAAADAQTWADRAVASAQQAAVYATNARNSANQAQQSADQAAASAKRARQAEQDAQAAAARAAKSASQAQASATQARGYADSAARSAAAARADAIAAGKSAQEAANLAAEAKKFAVDLQKLEESRTRQDDIVHQGNGEMTEDERAIFEAGGQAALDEYRAAQKNANKTIGDWLQENGAEILMEILGIDNIVNCVKDGDVGTCLWALVDVGSFFFAAAKLGKVSKAIYKVIKGISKFFEETSKARKLLDRSAEIIQDARKLRRPDPVACLIGFASERKQTAPEAVMAPAAKKCKVDHVSPVDRDYGAKGPHLNMDDGTEVRIGVDKNNKLIGMTWTNTGNRISGQEQFDVAVDFLMNDRAGRTKLLKNTEAALDQIKAGVFPVSDQALIVRMKQVCYRLRKLGVDE
jgi:chemotaxis protein histidine kinase CheA